MIRFMFLIIHCIQTPWVIVMLALRILVPSWHALGSSFRTFLHTLNIRSLETQEVNTKRCSFYPVSFQT